ncbi:DUF6941 family protein [Paenibacillus xanthanilyticus]|uniref:DUF6941 family protein n=1 Tax=Paenibacillus xanthanilyticus TaxID=1783531 RepID=A0ABV8JYI7_9BACL
MEASLIVCDGGEFLPEAGTHRLGEVVNRLSIPTVPYVVPLFTLAKLSYIAPDLQHSVKITAYTDDGEPISASETRIVRNQRSANQVPGVDISFKHHIVFYKEGVHTFQLAIDDELKVRYPLTVCIAGETAGADAR